MTPPDPDPNPSICVLYGMAMGMDGQPIRYHALSFFPEPNGVPVLAHGGRFLQLSKTVVTDGDGRFEVRLLRGLTVTVEGVGSKVNPTPFVVPDEDVALLTDHMFPRPVRVSLIDLTDMTEIVDAGSYPGVVAAVAVILSNGRPHRLPEALVLVNTTDPEAGDTSVYITSPGTYTLRVHVPDHVAGSRDWSCFQYTDYSPVWFPTEDFELDVEPPPITIQVTS